MRVALLDDEPRENENLRTMVERYAAQHDYDIHCETFTDGRTLLEAERFDLYFLDYRMDGMDGVAVGRALFDRYQKTVSICYLTGVEAAAVDVINAQIGAVGFLKKPVTQETLHPLLDRVCIDAFEGRLLLKKGRLKEAVNVNRILYLEAANKLTRVHFQNGEEAYSHPFTELERLLTPYPAFIRIHRSFIVNMTFIKAYDAKKVLLTDGTVLPLKSNKFEKRYRDFVFDTTSGMGKREGSA